MLRAVVNGLVVVEELGARQTLKAATNTVRAKSKKFVAYERRENRGTVISIRTGSGGFSASDHRNCNVHEHASIREKRDEGARVYFAWANLS
jgi:hypothetical protein